jgi:hypothetical protein
MMSLWQMVNDQLPFFIHLAGAGLFWYSEKSL